MAAGRGAQLPFRRNPNLLCSRRPRIYKLESAPNTGIAPTTDAITGFKRSQSTLTDTKRISPGRDLPPHSLMPTSMLLRSWLVSTISTHKALLSPALTLLRVLSTSRTWILNVEKNPVWRLLLKKTFYDHFCAGEDGREVRSTISRIKSMGFRGVILTYAREIVVNANEEEKGAGEVALQDEDGPQSIEAKNHDIESWTSGVMASVEMVTEGDILAIKLTGAGAAVSQALTRRTPLPKQMRSALERVCSRALERKVRIFMDAEQLAVQGGIDEIALDLMRTYNVRGNVVVYNTYQAYLMSTPKTLASHLRQAASEDFALGVKLVRGAYLKSEPRHIIHPTKEATDDCYNSIVEGLLTKSYAPMTDKDFPTVQLFLATHNKESALAARKLQETQARLADTSVVTLQYGQLLGMADDVSLSLLQLRSGLQSDADEAVPPLDVYKCLSWGSLGDCVSYLLRRAIENRDAVSRSQQEKQAIKREVWRRLSESFKLWQ